VNALPATTGDLVLLEPRMLWLALLIPLWFWRRRRPALRLAGVALAPRLPASARVRWRFLPRALETLGLLFTVVALARPVVRAPLPAPRRGIDILLCLDVSSSMAAKDLDPARTRLAVARDAAAAFVRQRADDRIGLIRFARFPELLSPPTLDHAALLQELAAIAPLAIDDEEDATGIGGAVARAAAVLRSSRAKSKVVILLTDGEENVYNDAAKDEIAPLHAAQLCAAVGARVYAIRAGADPRSATGAPDPATSLERLADRTGGSAYAVRDAAALAAVYRRIDALEQDEVAPPRWRFDERFAPLVTAAALLLFGGRLLALGGLGALP